MEVQKTKTNVTISPLMITKTRKVRVTLTTRLKKKERIRNNSAKLVEKIKKGDKSVANQGQCFVRKGNNNHKREDT